MGTRLLSCLWDNSWSEKFFLQVKVFSSFSPFLVIATRVINFLSEICHIHESLSYLEGRATVFHSCYLSVCADTCAGEKPSVVLGRFILPPACLQEEIRSKIGRFIWEKADALEEQPNKNLPEEPETARNGCEEEPEEALDLVESSEETDSETLAQGEFPYRALQEYPINNMVTGYASARDMKKYEGELHDFTPGTSGYAAYWVQSKFSIYCEKTKMKRKL
uniref:Telomere repeat binding bouquet formation protein 2 n=1 Tax=Cyanistes caeruleus TaxID=156563 RepID=A0A8C0U2W9_CYACU